MRGISRWHQDDEDERTADDFIKAAALCDDDDKLAAARVRGFLMRQDIPAVLAAGTEALVRLPESLTVWAALTNARLANKEVLAVTDSSPSDDAIVCNVDVALLTPQDMSTG